MKITVTILILGLLGYGLLRLLSMKEKQREHWEELDRGDGYKFKYWR